MIFCVGIISISETDSLFQLEDLQFEQINMFRYTLCIHTNTHITNQSNAYSDDNRFANGVEIFLVLTCFSQFLVGCQAQSYAL